MDLVINRRFCLFFGILSGENSIPCELPHAKAVVLSCLATCKNCDCFIPSVQMRLLASFYVSLH